MATANRTAYALLGLLAQGPKTGYEIKQQIEQTISHFWKESYGHIYPTLNRLMAEGLVTRTATEGGTARQRYQITAKGEAVFAAWLSEPVEPEGVRNELALKLYFGSATDPTVSRAHLRAHRAHHAAMLARYREEQHKLEAVIAAGQPEMRYHLMTLLLGIQIAEARIAWCDQALALLASAD